jgi:hypothetical protein
MPGELRRAAGEHDARRTQLGRERVAEPLLHDFEQLPRARCGDLLDGLLGKLAVADREIAVEPDLGGLVLGVHIGPAETEFQFLRLPVGEAQADAEVVGQVRAAHRHDARRVRRAVAVEHVVGRAGADIEHEHAVLALLEGRHHVARGQAREHQFAHFQIEAADHVDVVRQPLLLPVHGPVADLEPLAHEVFRQRRDQTSVDPKRPADVVHHRATLGELLRLREIAHGADIRRLDHVVGRLHVHRGLVVETLQMPAGLREKHEVDALAGIALRLLQRAVRALARGLVVDDAALDDAARGALAAADDRELAPVVFADEDADFGGADFNGADEGGSRAHSFGLGWELGKKL